MDKVTSFLFVAGVLAAFSLCGSAYGLLKLFGTDAEITFFARAFGLPAALKDARDAEAAALRDLFAARNENIRLERENRALARQTDEAASRQVGSSIESLERKLRTAELDASARRDEIADSRRRSDEFAARAVARSGGAAIDWSAAPATRATDAFWPAHAAPVRAILNSALVVPEVVPEGERCRHPPRRSDGLGRDEERRGAETAFRIVAPRPVLLVNDTPVSSELFQLFCPQEDCKTSDRPAIRLGGEDAQRVSLRFSSDFIEPDAVKKLELEVHVQALDGTRLTLRSDVPLR